MLRRIIGLILFFFLLPGLCFADNARQVDYLLNGMRDTSGRSLSLGKVYTYLAGTSTPAALYTARDKSGNATNPIILDSVGRAVVYGDGIYKFVVKNSSDVTLYTMDYLTYEVSDDVDSVYAGTSTGSANAYAISPSPAITAYATGLDIAWIANFSNSGAATLNVNGLGAAALLRADGSALQANDIVSSQLVRVTYVATAGFRLISQSGITPITAGGTGSTTASAARTALGVGTGQNPTFASITLSTGNITNATSDTADNAAIQIGGANTSRGAYASFGGNEHASIPGKAGIYGGNVAGGDITLSTTPAEPIKFQTTATDRWWITSGGNLVPQADNTYDIGATSTGDVKDIYVQGNIYKALGTWTPTVTGDASMTASGLTINDANYVRIGPYIFFKVSVSFTVGGTPAAGFSISAPVVGVNDSASDLFGTICTDNSTPVTNGCAWRYTSTGLYVVKVHTGASNWTAGTATINITGFYRAI